MKLRQKTRRLRLPDWSLSISLIILFCFTCQIEILAQNNLNFDSHLQQIHANGSHQDYKIPTSGYSYLYLEARGADGGKRSTSSYTRGGGTGANISATFSIGTAVNQLAAGGIIRFVIGKSGSNSTDGGLSGGGGGGGTGILYLPPGKSTNSANDWKLLMVAGGGGGASGDCCSNRTTGVEGQIGDPGSGQTTNGGGLYGANPGTDGNGGAAYHPLPEGGQGGEQNFDLRNIEGGFGFGAGSAGCNSCNGAGGGGGGGYTGGKDGYVGLGDSEGGRGGTSYINEQYAVPTSILKQRYGEAGNPKDGFAIYQGTNSATFFRSWGSFISLNSHTNKCIDLDDGNTSNGNKIQIWDCQKNNDHQAWILDGEMIRLKKDLNKCLNLTGGSTSNGANIQIWDCLNNWNQQWILDSNTGQIIFKGNTNKCLDLESGSTSNGTKLHLWDCQNNSTQAWTIPKRIMLKSASNKCIDLNDGNTSNGSAKIQIWSCQDANNHQGWVFDGNKIHSVINHNKCLDLSAGNTSNGAKIQLWDCQSGNSNQEWILDNNSRQIRFKGNTNKCLDLENGNTSNGGRIQLWDCYLGNINQMWLIR